MDHTCKCGNVITCHGDRCVVCRGGKQQPESKPEQERYSFMCHENEGAFAVIEDSEDDDFHVSTPKEYLDKVLKALNGVTINDDLVEKINKCIFAVSSRVKRDLIISQLEAIKSTVEDGH